MTGGRGFTLIELTVAMVLALLVGGLVHRQLVQGQRVARAQDERMALQDNVRVASLVIAAELGATGYDEISPAAGAALGAPAAVRSDLLAIAPGAVTYLAARGGGRVCGVVAGAPGQVVVDAASWASPRAPRATDSLLAFAEGDPLTTADDAWLHLGVVSSAAASCPGGQAGIALRAGVPPPLDPAVMARVTPGAPARLTEVMELRYYRSGGKAWLGMRAVGTGEVIQPVAGPLADSAAGARGLTLTWRDAAGNPTADPASVRTVDIALLGVTDQPVHGRVVGRATVDSFALTTRVALRNALRP
jgi:prepilin-type N-terminal cleavage/methylation domain-containing protein